MKNQTKINLGARLAILLSFALPGQAALIVSLGFNENSGTSVANSGTTGGSLTLTAPNPSWSGNTPTTPGNVSSLDFGINADFNYAESSAAYTALAGLSQFTISGWVNNRDSTIGQGGNRLVTWHAGSNNGGVDLVYLADGSLQIGIDQWPDGLPTRSSPDMITTDPDAGPENWRFFAVTYDSTLASGHLSYYFGSSVDDATLDVSLDYNRGAVNSGVGRLAIGHFNQSVRNLGQFTSDRMFRGLMDEIKIFDEALTPEQVLNVQRIPEPVAATFGFISLALVLARRRRYADEARGAAR